MENGGYAFVGMRPWSLSQQCMNVAEAGVVAVIKGIIKIMIDEVYRILERQPGVHPTCGA